VGDRLEGRAPPPVGIEVRGMIPQEDRSEGRTDMGIDVRGQTPCGD